MTLNSVLEQIYKSGKVEDGDGNLIDPFPAATPRETGKTLYQIVLEHNLDATLEIGMAYGLSSLAICQAHQDKGRGEHTAIDPHQNRKWKSIGLLNLRRAELNKAFRFIGAPSFEALPQLLREQIKFDFVFIDGSHLFDYALVDFFYVDKLLHVGGYVAFDDIWMPAIRRVLNFVVRNRSYDIVKIESEADVIWRIGRTVKRILKNPLEHDYVGIRLLPGNLCLLRKTADDSRKWKYYKPF